MNIAHTRVPVTKDTTLEDLKVLAQSAYDAHELRVSGSSAMIKLSSAALFRDAVSVVQHRQEFIALLNRTVSQALPNRPDAVTRIVERHMEPGYGRVYTVEGFRNLLDAIAREERGMFATPGSSIEEDCSADDGWTGGGFANPSADSKTTAGLAPGASFPRPATAPESKHDGYQADGPRAPTVSREPQAPSSRSTSAHPSTPPPTRLSSELDAIGLMLDFQLFAIDAGLNVHAAQTLARLALTNGRTAPGIRQELDHAREAVAKWSARPSEYGISRSDAESVADGGSRYREFLAARSKSRRPQHPS